MLSKIFTGLSVGKLNLLSEIWMGYQNLTELLFRLLAQKCMGYLFEYLIKLPENLMRLSELHWGFRAS